jgi:ADP-ribosylglycohydrolase
VTVLTGRRMIDRWEDDNKSFLILSIKQRVLPTIYGGIIGDLLGVPVEFRQRDTFQIDDVSGYGTYNQPPGTWSDDTSLTLCLVENIVEKGNIQNLMRKFVQYQDTGYWTPFGTMFDIGRTTVEAISRFKNGALPSECGGQSEYDNGNGAIMRISPLVFILYKEFDLIKKAEVIKQYTEITHAHPRAIVGSIIYSECLFRLYHNDTPQESLETIKRLFDKNFDQKDKYQEELKHYSRLFEKNFFSMEESEILSDGYVVHTLEAAIWCLGTTNSFKEAVLKAVNLGGDTDTVASLTGSLAGMYYKMDGIPNKWLEKIARKKDIDELIKKFYEFCANKAIIEEYGSL